MMRGDWSLLAPLFPPVETGTDQFYQLKMNYCHYDLLRSAGGKLDPKNTMIDCF